MKNLGKLEDRPLAEHIVREFVERCPEATVKEVISGTGLSKSTVYKYLDKIKREQAAGAAALSW